MSLKVKYHIVRESGLGIRSVSLSKDNVIAVATGSEEDWVNIAEMDQEYNISLIQVPAIQKRPISLLQWSPTQNYLATAFDKLAIWEFKNKQLTQLKQYSSHRLEITAIAWSFDGLKLASTSLDGKLTVYDVAAGTILQEIDCGHKTVGVVWDPFEKYLVCLKFDNTVLFYKINNWQLDIKVQLSLSSKEKQYTSKRDDRKIDWSPDCRYLLIPNLDDKLIPTVCLLDRNQEFQVARTYIGPFSSINVIKFCPKLFQNGDTEYSMVFAVGDNDGNISVWRLTQSKVDDDQPIMLLKGHKNGAELVEDLAWNSMGNLLMASTAKRYLILMNFTTSFGIQISDDQKQAIIKNLYGNTKNIAIEDIKQIRIYDPHKTKVDEPPIITITEPPVVTEIQKPQELKPIHFKISIENGKKRMMPISVNQPDVQQPSTQIQPIIHEILPLLQIKQFTLLAKNFVYQFPNSKKSLSFEIQKHPGTSPFQSDTFGTLMRCFVGSEVAWVDYFEGQVKSVQTSKNYIIVYTDSNLLYLETLQGIRHDAPLMIPFLSQLVLNAQDFLLCLQTNGDFKIINLPEKKVQLESDIRQLMKAAYDWMDKKKLLNEDEKKGKIAVDPLLRANLKLDSDGLPVPEFLFKDFSVYTYHKQYKQWIRSKVMQNNQEDFANSIKDADRFNFNSQQLPIQNESVIYDRLISQNTLSQAVQDYQQVAKLEEQLAQMRWSEDITGCQNTVQLYIRRLCDTLPLNYEKLRHTVNRFVLDKNSVEFKLMQRGIDMNDFRQKIVYILSQYPKAKPILYFIQPETL